MGSLGSLRSLIGFVSLQLTHFFKLLSSLFAVVKLDFPNND